MDDDPFEQRADEYDAWYERHRAAYRSELWAVREVMGSAGRALEVGVGTGRFAAPLSVQFGVDPATAVARRAESAGSRSFGPSASTSPSATAASIGCSSL